MLPKPDDFDVDWGDGPGIPDDMFAEALADAIRKKTVGETHRWWSWGVRYRNDLWSEAQRQQFFDVTGDRF